MYFILLLQIVACTSPLYTWIKESSMEGLMPLPRGGHSATQIGRFIYIFGGCDVNMQCYNDLHSYSTDTHNWLRLNSTGTPPGVRGGHSATQLGTRMIVFGGTSKGLEFNDLYEYDSLTNHWKNLLPEGEKPMGRCNHAAGIDSDGNIYIIGGFSSRGYLNDVWIYNPGYNRWVEYKTSGDAPTPRELHSFIIEGKVGYLFGGFHIGGVSGELYILDLELMTWQKAQDDGYLPEPREGHNALRISEFIFIIGGCDFALETCYNDVYVLDLLTFWWTKLENKPFSPLPPLKERSTSINMGSMIYTIGGCYLNKHCFNDVMKINTGIECNCEGHGTCRGGVCVCEKGYSGSDCSIRAHCREDCLLRGFCTSSGNCDCYPGYKGKICEYESGCPNNCTGILNGRCQPDGICECNSGYSGSDCMCECVNGYCYNGGCICKVGWIGEKCDFSDPLFVAEEVVEVETSEEIEEVSDVDEEDVETEQNEDSDISETDEIVLESTEEPTSDTEDTSSDTEIVLEVTETTSDDIEIITEDSETTEESLENLDSTTESEETSIEDSETTDESSETADNSSDDTSETSTPVLTQDSVELPAYAQQDLQLIKCSNCVHGKCIKGKCYCESSWTGDSCNQSISGINLIYAGVFFIVFFLIGSTIGYIYLCYKPKKHKDPEQSSLLTS